MSYLVFLVLFAYFTQVNGRDADNKLKDDNAQWILGFLCLYVLSLAIEEFRQVRSSIYLWSRYDLLY